MTEKMFDFVCPHSLSISQARLAHVFYEEDWEFMTFHPRPHAQFEPRGREVDFMMRVMLLEISGVLEYQGENQTRVYGEVRYSQRWQKIELWACIGLLAIMVALTISGLILGQSGLIICGGSGIMWAFIGFASVKLHQAWWVDGHEYEATRMIKRGLLT